MSKKSKNKQKNKSKLKKEQSNNMLVIDSYPPEPLPINSVKPTRSGERVPPKRRELSNTGVAARRPVPRGSGSVSPTPRRSLDKPGSPEKSATAKRRFDSAQGNAWQRFCRIVRNNAPRVFGAIIAFFALIFGGLRTLLRRSRMERTVVLIGIGLVALVIVASSLYLLLRNNAFSVNVDGEQIAIISMASVRASGEEDLSYELVTQARLRIEGNVGSRILINESIDFEPMRAARGDLLSVDEAIMRLGNSLTFRVEAAAISVEGTRMTIVRSHYEADRILNTLKTPHLGFGVDFVETGFVENVLIDMIYVDEEELQDSSTALQILTSTLATAQDYEVVPGDSLHLIAQRSGMTLEDLLLMNPAINPDIPLSIGTHLRLSMDQPVVSVRTVEARSFTTEIDPPVEYIHNPAHRASHRRAIQFGVLGEATVIEHVIRVNSMEVERIEVERIVSVQPVPEIIEVGTGP